MTSIKEYMANEKQKTDLLEHLNFHRVEHLDLIEDRELDLIITTLNQAETMMLNMRNDSLRINYLKGLMKVLLASSMLQAKAMFERLESEDE